MQIYRRIGHIHNFELRKVIIIFLGDQLHFLSLHQELSDPLQFTRFDSLKFDGFKQLIFKYNFEEISSVIINMQFFSDNCQLI